MNEVRGNFNGGDSLDDSLGTHRFGRVDGEKAKGVAE